MDSQEHTFGLGLVFDPGLGKKGDGWAVVDGVMITRDTSLIGASVPEQLLIEERAGSVAGMKCLIDLSSPLPDQLILANWKDLYQDHDPDFTPSLLRKLYDLTLKLLWSEQTVPAEATLSRKVTLNLQEPDFDTTLFMRWDLPGFLSIENNLLFPRHLSSFVETTNLTSSSKGNCKLDVQFPYELFSNTTSYQVSIPPRETLYQKVQMQSKEIYEDKIVDLSVTIENNGQLLDSLLRRIYVPATPVSDTGLFCTIDSVITTNYPEIMVQFNAQVEATRQRLFNLLKENVFLYENEIRINEFNMGKDTTGGAQSVDIVFVLDVTGSMGDEIQDVKNNIIEFTDSLTFRGIDYRLGMVCFLDEIENVYDFTNDSQTFKSYVAAQYAHGGGDGPENSLDALYRATQFQFRDRASRVFIWITDYSYHELDNVTPRSRREVIDQLLLNDVTVHAIGSSWFQTYWYNPIVEATGGNFYDIYGNFRDILLDISRLKAVSGYLISYTSPGQGAGSKEIKLEIHYAGLGGFAYAQYASPLLSGWQVGALQCFPNPFNPTIQIQINMDGRANGVVDIFNVLGHRVRSFHLKASSENKILNWNAKDDYDRQVAAGTYFIRLSVFGKDGKLLQKETAKVLFIK